MRLFLRFKEIPQIENIRIKRELAKRDTVGPDKAGPFHPPPPPEAEPSEEQVQEPATPDDSKDTDLEAKNGRPLFKKDDGPRKQRTEQPRSKSPSLGELLYWSDRSFSYISDVLTSSFLGSRGKKNLRQLTKGEFKDLESLKVDILTNLSPLQEVDKDTIVKMLKSQCRVPKTISSILTSRDINLDSLSVDDFRMKVIGVYIECVTVEN